MVLILAVPAFAEGEIEPTDEPETGETSSKFLDHPIVKLLAEFFTSFFNPPVEEDPILEEGSGQVGGEVLGESSSGEGEELPWVEFTEGDGEAEEPPVVPEEKIASMHEENKLGFGEIVKLTEFAKMTQVTCSETEEFCEVTLDSLIEEYKGGMSVGALFKKYGKPEHVGVGQIKKELNPKEKTNNGKPKNK